jgi:hypothetical protein
VYADLPITREAMQRRKEWTRTKKLYYASHTDAMDYIGGSSYPISNREEVRQKLLEMFFYISKKGEKNSGILLCLRNFYNLLRYFSTIYP